jgi:hypothetical protein
MFTCRKTNITQKKVGGPAAHSKKLVNLLQCMDTADRSRGFSACRVSESEVWVMWWRVARVLRVAVNHDTTADFKAFY